MLYLRAMGYYIEFEGRACRREFWEFLGGWFLLTMVAVAIDQTRAGPYGARHGLVTFAVQAVHLVPYCAVAARRSHDLDRTGWLALLGFVPFVGFGMLLVWAHAGTPGPNRFGPEPGSRSDAVASPGANEAARLLDPLSTVAEIERLADLLYAGALSDAEFETLKGRLMAGGRPL